MASVLGDACKSYGARRGGWRGRRSGRAVIPVSLCRTSWPGGACGRKSIDLPARPASTETALQKVTWLPAIALGVMAIAPDVRAEVSFHRQVRPILESNCGDCHNRDKKKGGLEAVRFEGLLKGGENGVVVVAGNPDASALLKSISGPDPEMPLSGDPLTAAEVALIAQWIKEGAINDMPPEATGIKRTMRDTPRARSRRLNRSEYNNTIRDLMGTHLSPADRFPSDDARFGFDRTDALTISLLHVEEYERAAAAVVDELLAKPVDDPGRKRIIDCDLQRDSGGCAEGVASRFLLRAWRRPSAPQEAGPFLALARGGEPGERDRSANLRLALRAILLSPQFMFHMEGTAPGVDRGRLAQFELASRLSYFLWSSLPDEDLLAAATAGALADPAVVRAHAQRMLKDPRARSLANDFAGQWLMVQRLADHTVSKKKFATWDKSLLGSMQRETLGFFEHFLRSDLPARGMLTADFTFVNDQLARLYGLEDPGSDELVKVSLAGTPRRGLLTQPGILTVASHPNRTSPTGRGLWVMDRILCEPPPPPPNIPELPKAATEGKKTVKEFLEMHREQARCKVCHELMDTIGLGFENYNAIGQFRTMEAGEPIQVSGNLPGDKKFGSAMELADILSKDLRFERCLTKQLLVYGVGHGFDNAQATVNAVTDAARKAGGRLADFIGAVVSSESFRQPETPRVATR